MMKVQNSKVKSQSYSVKLKTGTETRTYSFALKIIKFVDCLPRDMSAHIIAKQLLRAATSIGANVVEARSSTSRKDFAHFFSHALKSANETKFWLGLLSDSNKVAEFTVQPIITEVNELSNIIASSILTLKGKQNF